MTLHLLNLKIPEERWIVAGEEEEGKACVWESCVETAAYISFLFFFFKSEWGYFFAWWKRRPNWLLVWASLNSVSLLAIAGLCHTSSVNPPPHHHSTTPLVLIGSLQLSQTGSDWLAFSVTDGLSILHHTLLFVLFCLFFWEGSPHARHSIWALYGLQRENIDIWQEQVHFLFNPFVDGESEVRNLNSANYLFLWGFISQAWHKHSSIDFRWRLSVCHSFAVKSSSTHVRF